MLLFMCREVKRETMQIERKVMTNAQFRGVVKMIIALIKKDTPKEELIEYLSELIKE